MLVIETTIMDRTAGHKIQYRGDGNSTSWSGRKALNVTKSGYLADMGMPMQTPVLTRIGPTMPQAKTVPKMNEKAECGPTSMPIPIIDGLHEIVNHPQLTA